MHLCTIHRFNIIWTLDGCWNNVVCLPGGLVTVRLVSLDAIQVRYRDVRDPSRFQHSSQPTCFCWTLHLPNMDSIGDCSRIEPEKKNIKWKKNIFWIPWQTSEMSGWLVVYLILCCLVKLYSCAYFRKKKVYTYKKKFLIYKRNCLPCIQEYP